MALMRHPLTPDFFLLKSHRQRAQAFGFEREAIVPAWTVVSVEPTNRVEEVFCAVMPETHCFTLEDNILTGNCGGCCCRSGVKSLVRTACFFPDRFAALEEWEQGARSLGGARANRSIASRQRGGKK